MQFRFVSSSSEAAVIAEQDTLALKSGPRLVLLGPVKSLLADLVSGTVPT